MFKYQLTPLPGTTPLLFALLALSGCPGDDSMATTNNGDSSSGTNPLTTTDSTATSPTTADPDSSTSASTGNTSTTDGPTTTGEATTGSGSTTDGEPVCEPECADGECCNEGVCDAPPEPVCPGGCTDGEACMCTEGMDPCDCVFECVAVSTFNPYLPCFDATGMPSSGECEAGDICLVGAPDRTVCSAQGCVDATDCAAAPASGTALVTCGDVDGDMADDCYLSCAGGESCPAGMSCFDSSICEWTAPSLGAAYDDCSLSGLACQVGEECLHDGAVPTTAPTWAVCSAPGCLDAGDCGPAPTTGTAALACGDPGGIVGSDTCLLDCSLGETCPDGMTCANGTHCAWPAGSALFFDSFETSDFTMGWTLIDVDAQLPADPVAFVDDAWVVTDQFDGGPPDGNFSAYSNSWYQPPGQADDWLISPAIMVGANTQVSWWARAQDPAFPDGYEVRVSTAGPNVADLMVDPAIFSIASEASDGVYVYSSVDLAAAGYTNQAIHIGWRNNSNDQFVLLVDDVAVVDFP